MSISPRCADGEHRLTYVDPTGGNPFMGGPVRIPVCARCGVELWDEVEEGARDDRDN